ncbi:MBL fold metallo-hydrolase [Patescibacteria group bacterium]|nr:MBL fold metallo-hydrolase [Patescibacteria group bacterium]
MAEVKVLIIGHHSHQDGILDIGSSVALIKSDHNILVDSGYFTDTEEIIAKLKEENLTPSDIDIVVLTHVHTDHVANNYLFDKAKIYCKFKGDSEYPGQYHDRLTGKANRTDILDGTKLADGVEFLETPGHTNDSISVVVETKEGKVVIAGDAIAEEDLIDFANEPKSFIIYDLEKYNASRRKILAIADYIVPGHGPMFKIEK